MKFIMKSTMFFAATAATSFFPQHSFNQPTNQMPQYSWPTSFPEANTVRQAQFASASQPVVASSPQVWEPYTVPTMPVPTMPVAQPVAATSYPQTFTNPTAEVDPWAAALAKATAEWSTTEKVPEVAQPATTGSMTGAVFRDSADAFVQAQPHQGTEQFASQFGDHTSKPFKQDRVRKYNIEISTADINALNADITAEEYVPCSITTAYGTDTATTFEGCGCRYKGSVGSLLACIDSDTGKVNGKCRKFSIKVDANEFRNDKQKIEGNKKLMFHGMSVDKSLVSERMAYNAMQELGLPSPRAAHAEVFVNGNFDGIYTVVEEVEKVLTKRYFSEDYNAGKGPVYKDVWFEDHTMTEEYLDDAHKSGRKEHEFMQEIGAMVPYIGDCATLGRYFDLDSIAAVTAFNNLVGLFDDWRMKHNFFWYVREDASGKKLVMIPWDYDRLNDEFNAPGGKRRAHAQMWTETPNPFECANTASHASLQGANGRETGFKKIWLERVEANLPKDSKKPIECYHLTQMFAKCLDVDSKMAEFKAQLPATTLGLRMDEYAAQIAPSVAKDSSITSQEWKAGIAALKRYLANSATLATSPKSKPSVASVVPAVDSLRLSVSSFGSKGSVRSAPLSSSSFGSKFGGRSNVGTPIATRMGASGTFNRFQGLSDF